MDPRDDLNRTPLFEAASVGGTDSVKLLLDKGADVTIKNIDLQSAVRVAVGHTSTMDALLQVRQTTVKGLIRAQCYKCLLGHPQHVS